MPGRLTAFLATLLATLAVALAPFAGTAAAAPARDAERTTGCCGDACTCGDSCPCAAERDDGQPADDSAPSAPSERNERRSLGCPLPTTSAIELAATQAPGGPLGTDDRTAPTRPAGRALLSRISKWTT